MGSLWRYRTLRGGRADADLLYRAVLLSVSYSDDTKDRYNTYFHIICISLCRYAFRGRRSEDGAAQLFYFLDHSDMRRDAEENKIELTELNGFLQKEAAVDDLTGLSNRYALTRDQESFIGKSVYVTMADIDYFKRYNDTYGHLIGDKVLELVAACIKESFGDGYAYRFGGDEFLFVLTGCSHREYEDRIAKCSSGCGYGVPRNKDDFQKIIKEADDRLYDVKKART